MSTVLQQPLVRFGAFEVNSKEGELRKGQVRVKLCDKTFKLLLALIARPDGIVTREELREQLWPDRSCFEFDNGLNNAVSRLRDALGDTKLPHRYIETIPHHGYRLLVATSQSVASARIAGRHQWQPWIIAFGVAAIAITGIIFLHPVLSPRPTIHSLAVLSFRNAGADAAGNKLAWAMTHAVTTRLAELGVTAVPKESVARLESANVPIAGMARSLGVDGLVEGTVVQTGPRVRVSVRIVQANGSRDFWSGSYGRPIANLAALPDDVARGIAGAIGLKPPSALVHGEPPSRPVSAVAYQAYLDGSYLERRPNTDLLRAQGYLQQAVLQSPGFAPAYVGLSKFYLMISIRSLSPRQALPLAQQYAEKALRLDPGSATGHLQLANVEVAEWNWSAADQQYRRAIALTPGLAPVHVWYADYLDAMGEIAQALDQARQAVQLDPLSPAAHDVLAGAAFAAHQYNRSVYQCRQILLLAPNAPVGYQCMSQILVDSGKYDQSLTDLKTFLAGAPDNPMALSLSVVAYAHLGQRRQADKFLAQLQTESKRGYVSPVYLAVALVAIGRDNQAMADLEESYQARDDNLVNLKVNPLYQPLARDPRFQTLIRDMNYPSHAAAITPPASRHSRKSPSPTTARVASN